MNQKKIELIQNKQTLFSVSELSHFIKHSSDGYLRNRISFYEKKWILTNVAKWIYSIRWKKLS